MDSCLVCVLFDHGFDPAPVPALRVALLCILLPVLSAMERMTSPGVFRPELSYSGCWHKLRILSPCGGPTLSSTFGIGGRLVPQCGPESCPSRPEALESRSRVGAPVRLW